MYELSECVWMCKCVCVCYVILLPSVRSNNWSCFSILTSFCITFSLPLPLSFSIYAASLIWSVKSRNTLRRSRGLGWVRVVVFTISRLTSTHCLSHIWLYLLFPPHSLSLPYSCLLCLSSILRLALSIIHCPLLFGPHERWHSCRCRWMRHDLEPSQSRVWYSNIHAVWPRPGKLPLAGHTKRAPMPACILISMQRQLSRWGRGEWALW